MKPQTLACIILLLRCCSICCQQLERTGYMTVSWILVTGRHDPRIYAIHFGAAVDYNKNNTPAAIVSKSKVMLDRLDGVAVGDPAFIALSEDSHIAYVGNHHGAVDSSSFDQHGERGSISVMNVSKMIRVDNTSEALIQNWDSGFFGAAGMLVLPEYLIVAHSEGWLSEDGSNRISILSRKSGGRVGTVELPLGVPPHGCPNWTVPFVSPTRPPVVPFLAPDPEFGCWPNPVSLATGVASDNRTYLFSANSGTEDVSVMDLELALKGEPVAEIANRIPVQVGPFGMKASPDGKFIAVAARERSNTDFFGNTISIIEVDKAVANDSGAEVARILVGTNDTNEQTRPYSLAWTPDGSTIVVTNYASNSVSIVDFELALTNPEEAEIARIELPSPGNPKGVAIIGELGRNFRRI